MGDGARTTALTPSGRINQAQEPVLWPEASFSFLSQRSILPVPTETIQWMRMLFQLWSWKKKYFQTHKIIILYHHKSKSNVFLFSHSGKPFLRSTNTLSLNVNPHSCLSNHFQVRRMSLDLVIWKVMLYQKCEVRITWCYLLFFQPGLFNSHFAMMKVPSLH